MRLENDYTDIFTEVDDSIFTDGSIDPMGLRMIWTSLGGKIFQNRLNTISTNIRFYTINLFHHALIQALAEQYEEKIVNLTGKAPYDNRTDLYDGIIIFLECLLDHVMAGQEAGEGEGAFPGVSKLRGILRNDPASKTATQLPVDRKAGILVRHILLGIHGRHKGPFQQMHILAKGDNYYADRLLWKGVRQIFKPKAWNDLLEQLLKVINERVLVEGKAKGGNPIQVKLAEIKDASLVSLYSHAFLQAENFKTPAMIQFWEDRLGLADESTTAGIIYRYIRQKQGETHFQDALRELTRQYPQQEELRAISAIEPLLTSTQKVMNCLLRRGVSGLDADIRSFIRHHLTNPSVRLDAISPFLTDAFFNAEAKNRITKMMVIWQECTNPVQEDLFAQKLIDFHHTIMKQRGNLPWISISLSGSITQHRSFQFTDSGLNELRSYDWVNDYYLKTVISLYLGLHK